MSTAVEQAAVLVGKNAVEAVSLRDEVERVALNQRFTPPARSSETVTVNIAAYERQRLEEALERRAERSGEYDPLANHRIWGWGG